ncbi:hypothetical protein PpBr36_04613 [Pyricularia pennisetigena]|uniref:hypothetical protein n=1 Tax=Pyricularia pennisetigena TaxID=1578925 RepID=UPI00114D94DE|nr:hypothetical protein PpBr36_04613 [Pyricularia pennisetigena]TLS27136.1 hypothetical protein PpBr36_04613 [Pyricularia pennisetigena]
MAVTTDYKKFLAEQILTEDKVITYRYLGRSLGVRFNAAKQMLYEFHKSQNERKPGAIHATYLVYGVKSNEDSLHGRSQPDGDIEMASSMPEVEENSEQVPVFTVTLVKEENLEDCLAQYEQVTSIHVYSIGRHPMSKDPQLLSDAAQQALQIASADDPLELNRKLGNISNSQVRRRDRKGLAVPPPAAVKSEPKPSQPVKAEPPKPQGVFGKSNAPAKDESKSQDTSSAKSSQAASAASTQSDSKKPPSSMKRGGSGGLMQAFAKAKPKKKVELTVPSQTDTAMSDDGEDDSEAVPAPRNAEPADGAASRKTRKEREEELKRMMEEDDDDVEEEKEREDTPMEEPEEEPEEAPAPEAPKEPEEPAEVVSASTGDGRRRGRKRVMRKKQIMDDQGYLVTIQEAAWESFSEDETPPSSAKQVKPVVAAPAAASAAKGKKGGAKGQGNIMSFFSKK